MPKQNTKHKSYQFRANINTYVRKIVDTEMKNLGMTKESDFFVHMLYNYKSNPNTLIKKNITEDDGC
jgi:hypothetical protein